MPFYDLKCDQCNEEFNILAKMSEREHKLIQCPKCGSHELSTVYKSVNIVQSRKNSACPNVHKCGGCCGHQ